MLLATTLIFVFLLAGYSFACGFEIGNRMKIDCITPRNIVNPRFRLVYKNPRRQSR